MHGYSNNIHFVARFGLTFSSISAAVLLVVSRFSTRAVSPRKFPEAEERRESRLSSKVFKVILKPFCCFVRLDYRERRIPQGSQSYFKTIKCTTRAKVAGEQIFYESPSQLKLQMTAKMRILSVQYNAWLILSF